MKLPQLIHVDRQAASVDGDDQAEADRERRLMMTVSITFLIVISACSFGFMFMFVSSPLAMLAATLLCVSSVSALVVFLVRLTEKVIN